MPFGASATYSPNESACSEGAGVDVILDCTERLHLIKRLYVECHSCAARVQQLDELLQALRIAGLQIQIDNTQHRSRKPFIARLKINSEDMRADIFADRAGRICCRTCHPTPCVSKRLGHFPVATGLVCRLSETWRGRTPTPL